MLFARFLIRGAVLALALFIAGCASLGSSSLPEGNPRREWRAAAVLNITDDIKDEASARLAVEEVRQLGLNTIYVIAYQNGQAYYPSRVVPVFVPPGSDRPLTYDPLQAIITEARTPEKQRVHVYAWINPCQVWRSRDTLPERHIARTRPDLLTYPYDISRPPDELPEFWLDPGNPGVHGLVRDLTTELVSLYDLDGLLVDGLGYRSSQFGYNRISLKRFNEETKFGGRPAPLEAAWQQWRARQVTTLAEIISGAARLTRPTTNVAFLANCEGGFRTTFEQAAPYREYGQNWPDWMARGIADVIVLGAFKRQGNQEQARDFVDWLNFARLRQSGSALVVGVSARDNTILATRGQIEIAREAGAQGVALWRLRENNSEGLPRKKLFELLGASVFDAPAEVPALPWRKSPTNAMLYGFLRRPDGTPFSNARVALQDTQIETATHPDGLYVLFNAPAQVPVVPQAYVDGKLITGPSVELEPGTQTAVDLNAP